MALREISKGMKNLSSLLVTGCDKLTDESVREVIGNCPKLTVFGLGGTKITDETLKFVAKSKSIKKVWLSRCNQLTDKGIGYLCEYKNSNVVSLMLGGCLKITDKSVKIICSTFTSLIYLSLAGCQVSDESLCYVSKSLQLKEFSVSGMEGITETGIVEFLRRSKRLEILNFSSLEYKFTEKVLNALCETQPSLQDLNLSQCYLVNDHFIAKIVNSCKRLRKLNVTSCNLVTEKSIEIVEESLIYLQELRIAGCRMVIRDWTENKRLQRLKWKIIQF